jgi:glycosyltransferase involved in cell wall biosynthesis
MDKIMKLSVIIPCYNESENLPLVFSRLKKIVGKRKDIEIILVNNGSTDDSEKVFKKELTKDKNKIFKLSLVKVNKGYGYGILYGLKNATGDVLSWTHADMQTDPKDVLDAFELYKKQNDKKIFIKGKRKNRALLEFFFTFGMQIVTLSILKIYLNDINAQPKLFSKEFFNKFLKNDAPHDFSLDLYAMYQAKKNGYKILTIPVYFAKRQYGEAKGGGGGSWKNRIKLIKRTFRYIFRLKIRLTDS